MQHKKIPPYALPLLRLQQDGVPPRNSINIFIGDKSWQKGKSFSVTYPTRTITLPPWKSPANYQWPVMDCDILIHDTGYASTDYLDDLVYCLYKSGALIVRSIAPDFSLTVYEKDCNYEKGC